MLAQILTVNGEVSIFFNDKLFGIAATLSIVSVPDPDGTPE